MTNNETITQVEREAMRERAKAIGRYHTEHAGYGGASRDLHVFAETLLNVDVPRLLNALEAAEKRVEEETQAAIEAEARAGQAACDLARLQPLVDAVEEYKKLGYTSHEGILKIIQNSLRPTLATAVCGILRAVHQHD